MLSLYSGLADVSDTHTMLKFIAALLLLASLVGANERIAGGSFVRLGEIPFIVSIQDKDTFQHYCGGVIIDPFTALTSAKCMSSLIWGDMVVVAGTVDIGLTPTSLHEPDTFTVHPNFAIGPNNIPENDIAVFKVDPRFPFDSVTGRAYMPPTGFQTSVGNNLTIAGWGTTSLGGVSSSLLLKTEVTVVDKVECAATYTGIGMTLPNNQLCAGKPEGGADACDMDNGGPMFKNGILYGIFSWGGGCGMPGIPGVYTEISAYRPWIESIPNP